MRGSLCSRWALARALTGRETWNSPSVMRPALMLLLTQALVFGAMTGYTHQWSERFRSTVSGGYVHLDNSASQAGDAYHQTVYTSANVVFQYHKRLSIGFETLYGHHETRDGSDGDVVRFTAGLVYTIFD